MFCLLLIKKVLFGLGVTRKMENLVEIKHLFFNATENRWFNKIVDIKVGISPLSSDEKYMVG